MGRLLGDENVIFLIRDFDDATRAGAPVESYQFVVLEVARRTLGSVLDVGKRRRRMRGRFHRWMQIKTGPQQCADLQYKSLKFWIQSSLASTETGARGLGDYPTPDLPRESSASRSTSEKSK